MDFEKYCKTLGENLNNINKELEKIDNKITQLERDVDYLGANIEKILYATKKDNKCKTT